MLSTKSSSSFVIFRRTTLSVNYLTSYNFFEWTKLSAYFIHPTRFCFRTLSSMFFFILCDNNTVNPENFILYNSSFVGRSLRPADKISFKLCSEKIKAQIFFCLMKRLHKLVLNSLILHYWRPSLFAGLVFADLTIRGLFFVTNFCYSRFFLGFPWLFAVFQGFPEKIRSFSIF